MNCIESLVGCWRDVSRDGIMRTMLAMGSNGTDVAYGTALLVNNSLTGLRAQTQHAHGSKFHPQPCRLAPMSDGLLKGQLQRTAGFFRCIVAFAWPPWKKSKSTAFIRVKCSTVSAVKYDCGKILCGQHENTWYVSGPDIMYTSFWLLDILLSVKCHFRRGQ